MAECWSCGAERGDRTFCAMCEKIQPVNRARTSFELFGLPRRMRLDRSEVERRFRELSKDVHPDRFGRASPIERRLALEHTTHLNDAYRVLENPQRRAEYLLGLEGVSVGAEDARTDDPELLELMMDLQERTAVAGAGELDRMASDVGRRESAILARIEAYFDRDEGTKDDARKALEELRFVKRLGQRLRERIEVS
jgi:molecular chaperone HscB